MIRKLLLPTAIAAAAFLTACAVPKTTTDTEALPLVHKQCLEMEQIAHKAEYAASVELGKELEFKLGEKAIGNETWKIFFHDPETCEIEIDHEKEGVWPFLKPYAEIEIKGLDRGEQDIVLHCGYKRITIHLTTF